MAKPRIQGDERHLGSVSLHKIAKASRRDLQRKMKDVGFGVEPSEGSIEQAAYPSADRMIEGPEAYQRFERTMKGVLAVPHAVIQQRIEEERRQAALNPNRPGPKPKRKTRSKG
jgi:hypothetical protein